ncbi:ficolin-2-like [Scylla paramamosain]|uniref:ficolin-2-like n=1 Tax=Scylla paramamosain TaxID=85552 RepID=UPI0030828373
MLPLFFPKPCTLPTIFPLLCRHNLSSPSSFHSLHSFSYFSPSPTFTFTYLCFSCSLSFSLPNRSHPHFTLPKLSLRSSFFPTFSFPSNSLPALHSPTSPFSFFPSFPVVPTYLSLSLLFPSFHSSSFFPSFFSFAIFSSARAASPLPPAGHEVTKTSLQVWCDHTTNGGGWTVLLARLEQAKQEDFSRGWAEYKKGIGDPAAEHWLGLEALHVMTKGRNHELRVNITDWNNGSTWAEWKEFRVAPESEKYKLTVGRYTSDSHAGDALKWHNGMQFSTPDRDNDVLLGGHCAKKNDGGWWFRGYRGCYQAHPTGRYQHNPGDPPKTSVTSRNFELGPVLVWQNWRGESYYPKTLFLMFRPMLN